MSEQRLRAVPGLVAPSRLEVKTEEVVKRRPPPPERTEVVRALTEANGCTSKAARVLGLSRGKLIYWKLRYRLDTRVLIVFSK